MNAGLFSREGWAREAGCAVAVVLLCPQVPGVAAMEKWSLMTITVLLALTVRWAVSLGSYSGKAPAQAAAASGRGVMGLAEMERNGIYCLFILLGFIENHTKEAMCYFNCYV